SSQIRCSKTDSTSRGDTLTDLIRHTGRHPEPRTRVRPRNRREYHSRRTWRAAPALWAITATFVRFPSCGSPAPPPSLQIPKNSLRGRPPGSRLPCPEQTLNG